LTPAFDVDAGEPFDVAHDRIVVLRLRAVAARRGDDQLVAAAARRPSPDR
jgi:hypothetical protein